MVNVYGLTLSDGVSASEIIPGLWIGNQCDVDDLAFLEKNIDVVVTVSGLLPRHLVTGVAYIVFPLPQPFGKDGNVSARKLITIMKKYSGLRMLVACWEGVDRSSTLTHKHMVDNLGYTAAEARKVVQKNRSIVHIHEDWWL